MFWNHTLVDYFTIIIEMNIYYSKKQQLKENLFDETDLILILNLTEFLWRLNWVIWMWLNYVLSIDK